MDQTVPPQRIAWVTGAGKGIGRGLARRLADEGWHVAASARTGADLDTLAAAAPGRIVAFPLDVTDGPAVLAAAAAIVELWGVPDLVVLGAGIFIPLSASNFELEAFERTLSVNVLGVVAGMAAVLPRMRERRSGHIAVIASVAGFVGLPGAAAYGASKAALNTMCEALAPDLARDNLVLTVINPGFVDTPMTEKNDFAMPYMVSVDEAVERIIAGLEARRFEISFPWQMRIGLKLLGALPHRALFAITRRMLR